MGRSCDSAIQGCINLEEERKRLKDALARFKEAKRRRDERREEESLF